MNNLNEHVVLDLSTYNRIQNDISVLTESCNSTAELCAELSLSNSNLMKSNEQLVQENQHLLKIISDLQNKQGLEEVTVNDFDGPTFKKYDGVEDETN